MCFPIGYICDLIGRKLAMLLLVIPFIAGYLIIIFANSLVMLYVGRFITGMAGGAFCVSAPMYTSEIAQKEIRGALGSYFQLLLTVGVLFAYVVATFTSIIAYTIICAVIPLIFGVVFFFQPETPVYLLKKGKEQEARASLIRLRGNKYDVDAEIRDIKAQLEADEANKVPFAKSFSKLATKKAFFISFGLMFFQQLSGVNAVIFYTSTIFEDAGVDLGKVATIIVGAMQVGATFVASLIVDKLGRKILLLGSAFFMAVSVALLGIYFTLSNRELVDKDTVNTLSFLPVLSLCVFMVAFSLGFGPIPWMISAEVFPAEVKSVASSAAGTFNWFLAFIVTNFYLELRNAIGGDVTFYIFTGISLVGTAFVFFIVPETKGKTLSEIQRELGGEPALEVASHKKGIDNEGFN